jgi:hypothetical protein
MIIPTSEKGNEQKAPTSQSDIRRYENILGCVECHLIVVFLLVRAAK